MNFEILGQCVSVSAQNVILCIAAKFSSIWLSEKQRSLANSVAIGSIALFNEILSWILFLIQITSLE